MSDRLTIEGPVLDPNSRLYAYYFESSRPAWADRLIERKHERIHRIVRRYSSMAQVLEVGPGEGRIARIVTTDSESEYTAIEASPAGVERLRSAGLRVHAARVPPFPRTLDTYDCILASHVIEHLGSPEEVRMFLVGATSHLSDGGIIALVFPDARCMGFDFWEADYTHQWPSTERRVRQVAADAGLDVVACMRLCLWWSGRSARALAWVARLYPYWLLATLFPRRREFFYRGKLLASLDVVMILVNSTGRQNRSLRRTPGDG
jgi:cyclopropane fatty-acyl-phospholipid synthase-like methyltransferase